MATDELHITVASEPQKMQAFMNVHEVWPHHADPQEHLRLRLASIQHLRAQWYAGSYGEEVVTSLGVYPLKFHFSGAVKTGITLGAIHTKSHVRGRGLAEQLVNHVLAHARQQGCELALLYSDIKPAYYERFGFSTLASQEFNLTAAQLGTKGWGGPALTFTRSTQPQHDLQAMARFYQQQLQPTSVAIHRDAEYFNWLYAREPHCQTYLIFCEDKPIGYMIMKATDTTVTLLDLALDEHWLERISVIHLLSCWLEQQNSADVNQIHGWLHNNHYNFEGILAQQRSQKITMLAPLHAAGGAMPFTKVPAHQIFSLFDHC